MTHKRQAGSGDHGCAWSRPVSQTSLLLAVAQALRRSDVIAKHYIQRFGNPVMYGAGRFNPALYTCCNSVVQACHIGSGGGEALGVLW